MIRSLPGSLLDFAPAGGRHGSRELEANLVSSLIAEGSHFDVFDAEPLRPVRGPFDGDLVIEVRPRWMMSFGFAFFSDDVHEPPCVIEGAESELADDPGF